MPGRVGAVLFAALMVVVVVVERVTAGQCSIEAVIRLEGAVRNGTCVPRGPLPLQVDHATASSLEGPLSPPSFAAIQAEPTVFGNVSMPRTGWRMYAGVTPWSGRGGLDTIGTMTRLLLQNQDQGSKGEPQRTVFESGALTLLSLLLENPSTARSRFVCALQRQSERDNIASSGHAFWPSALRFVNRFVQSSEQVKASVLKLCSSEIEIALAAFKSARNCPSAALLLARLVIDFMLLVPASQIFNASTMDESGKLTEAGYSPSTILYTSVYPTTASRYGNFVVLFAPSSRSLDLQHFQRHGPLRDYFLEKLGPVEPVDDAGEMLVPGYLGLEEEALGFELKDPDVQAEAKLESLPQAIRARMQSALRPLSISTGFYRLNFAGVRFIAVVAVQRRFQCVEAFTPSPPHASHPGFFPCELHADAIRAVQFPPRRIAGAPALGVFGLVFRASALKAKGPCRVASALLALLNLHLPLVESPDARGMAILARILGSWDSLYLVKHTSAFTCVSARNARSELALWSRPPLPVTESSGKSKTVVMVHCQVVIPEGVTDAASSRELKGVVGEEFVLRFANQSIEAQCRLVCSTAGVFVPLAAQPLVCDDLAHRLLAGDATGFSSQVWWATERLTERRECRYFEAPLLSLPLAVDVHLAEELTWPFVVAAVRWEGVTSKNDQLEIFSALQDAQIKHVFVIEIDMDKARFEQPRIFYVRGGASVSVAASLSSATVPTTDYAVLLCQSSQSCRPDRFGSATMVIDLEEVKQSMPRYGVRILTPRMPGGYYYSYYNKYGVIMNFGGVVFVLLCVLNVLLNRKVRGKVKV